jgi:hypothetical protein
MGWVWLGIAVAVASLVVLAVLLLSLWRRTKALMRAVAVAGESIAAGTEALSAVQTPVRKPAQGPAQGRLQVPARSGVPARPGPRADT